VIFGADREIKEGQTVKRTGAIVDTPSARACSAGSSMRSAIRSTQGPDPGRQADARRRQGARHYSRKSVNEPMATGLKAIDALIPIGRGQRELIIGDRQTGKTAVALDTILNQKPLNAQTDEKIKLYCIYVANRPEALDRRAIRQGAGRAGRAGIFDHRRRHRFRPGADAVHRAVHRLHHGRILPRQWHACVIIYDDLSKQAVAYRQMSLLLRRRRAAKPIPATCSICIRACSSAPPIERRARLGLADGAAGD